MAGEDRVERVTDSAHLIGIQRRLGVERGVAGGNEQGVLLPERDLEVLRQRQDHLAAWLRPAGLEKAEVARGDIRLESEIELAHPAPVSPLAQQPAGT